MRNCTKMDTISTSSKLKYYKYLYPRLLKRNWIRCFCKANQSELLNPVNYHANTDLKFTMLADRNIYKYIIEAEFNLESELHRDAIGLAALCRLSNINLDPHHSLYEGYDFKLANLEQSISEMETYDSIVLSEPDELLNFSIYSTSYIKKNYDKFTDYDYLRQYLVSYETIVNWKSLYLLNLKLIESISKYGEQKSFEKFIHWMHNNFRYSLVLVIYSSILLSGNRMKNMYKFKIKSSSSEKRKQVQNMTWDLYILDTYFQSQRDNEKNNNQVYLASNDNVVAKVAEIAKEIQFSGSFEPLNQISGGFTKKNKNFLEKLNREDSSRSYNQPDWEINFETLRNQEISNLEKIIFQ